MNKNNTRTALAVTHSLMLSYVAQISHVPAATVAAWSLHEWAGAVILVAVSGVVTWYHMLDGKGPSIP